jgi:hypothetical protein
MTRRLETRNEDGFALIAAIIVTAIALLIAGATLTFAIRGISSSTHSRNEEVSIHAADSGVDVALWRTNKILVSNAGGTLLGFVSGAIQTVGCLGVTAGTPPIITINTSNTPSGATGSGQPVTGQPYWCSETPSESAGSGGTFRYYESTSLSVAVSGVATLTRRVVSLGTSGTITRRVLAIFAVSLGNNNDPLSLWKQTGYYECPSVVPSASAPDSGCPYPHSP